jgi:hypothetical protein
MIPALILLTELIALYFLSRVLTQGLYNLFLLLFCKRPIAVSMLLVLQFPGTVLHELSHLFTAEILGVRTGKLRLEPETIRHNDPSTRSGQTIQSGSVSISSTDPVRRAIIGLAPLFWGLTALVLISYVLPSYIPVWSQLFNTEYWSNPSTYLFLVFCYLLFAISNTMFPSPADLKGFTPLVITIAIIVGILWFVGIRFAITGGALDIATQILITLTKSLGVVLGLNLILFFTAHVLQLLVSRVLKVKILK